MMLTPLLDLDLLESKVWVVIHPVSISNRMVAWPNTSKSTPFFLETVSISFCVSIYATSARVIRIT